jgi:hypothetical protein
VLHAARALRSRVHPYEGLENDGRGRRALPEALRICVGRHGGQVQEERLNVLPLLVMIPEPPLQPPPAGAKRRRNANREPTMIDDNSREPTVQGLGRSRNRSKQVASEMKSPSSRSVSYEHEVSRRR